MPGRRDIYPGEQVTIFDNRGICQHSGLCTDRLPTAFRTRAEPFVAPSGARMDELVRAVRDCPSGALSLAFDSAEARDLVERRANPVPVGRRPARADPHGPAALREARTRRRPALRRRLARRAIEVFKRWTESGFQP